MRRPNNRRRFTRREEEPEHRINEKIYAKTIRLIREGAEPIIIATSEAIKKAEEAELDLVEISPKADPPVCKILDYKKFLYNKKKKAKELKSKQSKVVLKEIRFGPNTDDHDFEFKLAHAKKFLKEGNKVKAYVFFRGRTIVFKDRGEILLLRLAQELEDYGIIEQMPKLEGKRMIMMINSKKK
ncbi:MAG: translation initiation factor IF-3 [Crocinitomicaceae bacterium]|nr:translation initiation factor IF-3 [Crocinitomicaceae bacterium]|tara:strand:- start:1762 stop:2313 length:552 start_codon:yes stop_codon:yes gene_type:complete